MKCGSGCPLPAQVSQLVLFVYRQMPAPAKTKIQLRVFASSWQINVLPYRQVFDKDSCLRINAEVMKIRLFKPKTSLNTEIHRSQNLQFTG
jgi:hypothetical protein